ncbi:MAG TPA: type II toxin-antitoxin system prevent-host-death family antitoxin [Desulfotomaculum sp.]|nr:type II toxin-antitoxin system prevent-host-death family antitoxin [Desulfotomaculum sp.]
MEVGIREIRDRFSRYLKRVKQGETLVVTERNTPIAKLVPADLQAPPEILSLVDSRLASWKGGKPLGLARSPSVRGEKTLAEMITEDRR